MPHRDLVVTGGSAGCVAVLRRIIKELPADFLAAILIVTHAPSESPGHLAELLSFASAIPVAPAVDGEKIEAGRCYIAVPDHHLLVINGMISLGCGPRENLARPAIDPLFRSAALSYGSRTVGVILSGYLNDGASGLRAIKAVGGAAIV